MFARCFVWKRPIYEAWGLTCFSLNVFCEVSRLMFFNKATNTNSDVHFRKDSVMKSLIPVGSKRWCGWAIDVIVLYHGSTPALPPPQGCKNLVEQHGLVSLVERKTGAVIFAIPQLPKASTDE